MYKESSVSPLHRVVRAALAGDTWSLSASVWEGTARARAPRVRAQRNYRFFLLFILTTTALDVLVFVFAWLRLIWLVQHDPGQASLGDAIVREPAAMFLVAFTFLAFWCASGSFNLGARVQSRPPCP